MAKPPLTASNKLILNAGDMDAMIRVTQKHRSNLVAAGHIDHFGRAVTPPAPSAAAAPEPVTHEGYCLKHGKKVKVQTESVVDHSNGAKRAVGKCPECGTPVHTLMSAAKGQQLSDLLKASGGEMPQ